MGDQKRLSAEDRYRSDPLYHHVVDSLYMMIEKLDLTPSEVRECAMLACLKYEQMNFRQAILLADGRVLELRTLGPNE